MPSIAVIGHPASGKSTFLRGIREHEASGAFDWVEMPGIHMLGRNTDDEKAVYDRLLGRDAEPDVPAGIVALANVRHLNQQLFLVSQLIDLRLPVVVGLTGIQAAEADGIVASAEKLGHHLGVNVIDVFPDRFESIDRAMTLVQKFPGQKKINRPPHWRPSVALADAFNHFDQHWGHSNLNLHTGARFIEGIRLLTVPSAIEEYTGHPAFNDLQGVIETARSILDNKNERWTTAEVVQRHNGLGQILQSVVKKVDRPQKPSRKWFSRSKRA